MLYFGCRPRRLGTDECHGPARRQCCGLRQAGDRGQHGGNRRAFDHPYSLTFATWALGYFYIIKDELSHAITLLERGVAVSREWSFTLHSVQNTGLLGYAYALSERIAEGIPLLEHAVGTTETLSWPTPE